MSHLFLSVMGAFTQFAVAHSCLLSSKASVRFGRLSNYPRLPSESVIGSTVFSCRMKD